MANDLIVIATPQEVEEAYKNAGVNARRTKAVNDKFLTVPEKFKVFGLIFVDVTVSGVVNKNIPAFAISDTDKSKYVLVGQFMSSFTDKTTASQVTKAGKNKDQWLVVNNKKVNDMVSGMSEAEVVAWAMGKSFVSAPATNFPVYSGVFTRTGDVINVDFHPSAELALKAVQPKSYRVISREKVMVEA